jgi:KDO2-lipid IV(A) lauroyltransferase
MWKTIRYRIEYWITQFIVDVLSRFPLGAIRSLGASLGWLGFEVFRVRRKIAVQNLCSAFRDESPGTMRAVGRRSYMNLGRSLMEFTAFRRLPVSRLLDMVAPEGMEHLDGALARGRGAILFTGHYGNWELLGGIIARYGYPIHVTVFDHRNKLTDGLMCALRRKLGMQVILPGGPVETTLRLLSGNRFVSILADQDARERGVFVEFLGRPASTARGPAVLAIRQRCPIIPCFMVRDGGDRHRAVIEAPQWPDTALKGGEAIQDLTQRYTRRLEAYVRDYPDLYFWPHRRWKTSTPSIGRG